MHVYLQLVPVVFAALMVITGLALFLRYHELWARAQVVKAGVGFPVIMKLDRQGVPVRVLLDAYIRTRQSHIHIAFERYLDLYRRGGNPTRVSMALVLSKSAGLEFDFEELCDIELHRMDAFNFVDQEVERRRDAAKGRFPRR